jgi:hypothetical protein
MALFCLLLGVLGDDRFAGNGALLPGARLLSPSPQPMRLFLAIVLFLFPYQMIGEIFFGLLGLVPTQ